MRMKRQNDSRVTHQKGDKGRPERSHPRPAVQGEAERNPVWQSLAMRSGIIQPKLTVGKVDDPYEREADRVADQVMRMPAPRSDGHGVYTENSVRLLIPTFSLLCLNISRSKLTC
jgi:hypothetical protein